MTYQVLEVNVDDLGLGGVYALVKNVIKNRPDTLGIDIACIERFANPENIQYVNSLGASVHYVGYEGNKIVKQFVCINNLRRLIRDGGYDCVHIHSDVAYKLLVYGLAARLAGVQKRILHSHAAGVDGSHRRMKELFHKCSRRFLKYLATDYLSCSDLATQWMFPNVDSAQVQRVNNGVDLDKFRFDPVKRVRIRQALELKDEFLIGHVGRFAYQKNHDYLIDLFAAVRTQIPNAKLLLVGEGDLKQEVRQKVARLGLSGSVIFYGISYDVQELFQAMDVCILPSHFEGLPIVGVEAQAAGLPVIFSDQITKEAQLIDEVSYLPITPEAIPVWCRKLIQVSGLERRDTYQELTEKGFRIQDTVNQLLSLYN